MNYARYQRPAALILTGMLLACASQAAPPTELSSSSTGDAPQPPLPPPTSTNEPDSVATPPDGLADAGSWLAFISRDESLWVVNADGGSLTQMAGSVFYQADMEPFLANRPDAAQLTFATMPDAMLSVMTLPEGGIMPIARLTDTPQDNLVKLPLMQAPQWSPDGQMMSFVSMHEGDTADPYIYEPERGEIVRVAPTPYHAYRTIWSPDGCCLAYVEADHLAGHEGDGAADPGIWIVDLVNPEPRRLAPASPIPVERFAGWLGPETVIVFDGGFNSAPSNIRAINTTTGEVAVIWRGYASSLSAIAIDSDSHTLMFTVAESWIDFLGDGTEYPQGVYLYADNRITVISEQAGYAVGWSAESGRYYVQVGEAGTLAVAPDGVVEALEGPLWWEDFVSRPGSDEIAWRAPFSFGDYAGWEGIWLGIPGAETERLASREVRWASWSPDGAFLWLADGESALHVMDRADTSLSLIHSAVGLPGEWVSSP